MNKELIANTCEDFYKECLREIPQYQNGNLIWILNGSTLCNILYNVVKIDDISVNDEFRKYCYEFIRQPKGDIDISYRVGRKYLFDLDNKYIKAFQNISEEVRTYNFVDHNSEITEDDLKEVCTMETKSGLKFVAKKPQYLFLYKLKELLSIFHKEILIDDIDSINSKKKNIISDVINLYKIAISYCKKEELDKVLIELKNKSFYLHNLYNDNKDDYCELINKALDLLNKSLKKEKIII